MDTETGVRVASICLGWESQVEVGYTLARLPVRQVRCPDTSSIRPGVGVLVEEGAEALAERKSVV